MSVTISDKDWKIILKALFKLSMNLERGEEDEIEALIDVVSRAKNTGSSLDDAPERRIKA